MIALLRPLLFAGGQSNEVLNGLRRVVAEEVHDNVAEACVDGCFCCCCGSHTAIVSRRVNAEGGGNGSSALGEIRPQSAGTIAAQLILHVG